jgi:hypothetical protein
MKKLINFLFVFFLSAFAVLTLFLSTSIFLDLFGIRAKEGNYVLFVVWANFICSILYLIAVFAFLKRKKSTIILLGVSTIILIAASLGLQYHIKSGGVYETKTIGALIFRTVVTLVFAVAAYYLIIKQKK